MLYDERMRIGDRVVLTQGHSKHDHGIVTKIERYWVRVKWDKVGLLAPLRQTWEKRTSLTCLLPE